MRSSDEFDGRPDLSIIGLHPGDGVKVRLGPLVIDVNDCGFGTVLYDGNRVPAVGFTVHVQAGKLTRVMLEPST